MDMLFACAIMPQRLVVPARTQSYSQGLPVRRNTGGIRALFVTISFTAPKNTIH